MLLRNLVFISLWLNFKIFLILLPLIRLIVWFTCRIWILHLCATSSAWATVACLHKLWVLIGDGPYPDWLLTCLQRWEILSLVWLWLLGSILLLVVVVLSLPATATIWASRLTVWAVLLFIAGGGGIRLLKAASLLLLTFCVYFAHWWCDWRALNLLKIFYNLKKTSINLVKTNLSQYQKAQATPIISAIPYSIDRICPASPHQKPHRCLGCPLNSTWLGSAWLEPQRPSPSARLFWPQLWVWVHFHTQTESWHRFAPSLCLLAPNATHQPSFSPACAWGSPLSRRGRFIQANLSLFFFWLVLATPSFSLFVSVCDGLALFGSQECPPTLALIVPILWVQPL